MTVNEYVLGYINDLHRFELRKTVVVTNEYMDYYNAVVINDEVKRLNAPCLISFDSCVLYTENDDSAKVEEELVEFLKTYYRGRIYSTKSALEVLEEQFPSKARVSSPLEDVEV